MSVVSGRLRRAVGCALMAAVAALGAAAAQPGIDSAAPVKPVPAARYRVLVFTRTLGFRHDSIPAAVQAVRELGAVSGFDVEHTEDPAAFTDQNLARFRVVVFLLTTGDVLGPAQEGAMERFVRSGRGFVGVHSAADTEYGWAWYGGLVGAYFKTHPAIQGARVWIEDAGHPSTAGLPNPWDRTDEWYDFQTNPRGQVSVLARVDPATYAGSTMGPDHPIAWYHLYDGGRAWYTGMGHTAESYAEPAFRAHLLGGIRWAALGH